MVCYIDTAITASIVHCLLLYRAESELTPLFRRLESSWDRVARDSVPAIAIPLANANSLST